MIVNNCRVTLEARCRRYGNEQDLFPMLEKQSVQRKDKANPQMLERQKHQEQKSSELGIEKRQARLKLSLPSRPGHEAIPQAFPTGLAQRQLY